MTNEPRLFFARRVLYAFIALIIGVATNTWHRNVVSILVVLIAGVALAVWLGTELGKK